MLFAGFIFKRLIKLFEAVAVKENHTSSFQPLSVPHVGFGKEEDCVAPWVEPAVIAAQFKSGFTVSGIAPVQLSFAGGGGGVPIHKLKDASVVTIADVVNTLIQYV